MRVAFLFPGQGSQSLGMLAGLAAASDVVTETFAEASARLGYDLWKLVQEGPPERLNRTEHTQPAMLAAGTTLPGGPDTASRLKVDDMRGASCSVTARMSSPLDEAEPAAGCRPLRMR